MKKNKLVIKDTRFFAELIEVYFITNTNNKWQPHLKSDENKMMVIP
jgi:hypothetical protein